MSSKTRRICFMVSSKRDISPLQRHYPGIPAATRGLSYQYVKRTPVPSTEIIKYQSHIRRMSLKIVYHFRTDPFFHLTSLTSCCFGFGTDGTGFVWTWTWTPCWSLAALHHWHPAKRYRFWGGFNGMLAENERFPDFLVLLISIPFFTMLPLP